MDEGSTTIDIQIVAFGPIAERLGGRQHQYSVQSGTTIRGLVEDLGLGEWISFGLSVAVDGDRCSIDTEVKHGAEIALLPPVSGG